MLEDLLTEYIGIALKKNCTYSSLASPIAVHFGAILPQSFVCTSMNEESKSYRSYDNFKKFVQRYAVLAKAQDILINGIVRTLGTIDEA